MLKFNTRGYIEPSLNIKTNISEFELEFVNSLNTPERVELYKLYRSYSDALKLKLKSAPLLQWINGSFATKKPEPTDFDLVTFIDYEEIISVEHELADFKFPNSMTKFGIDAYIVKVYPRGHVNYPLYMGDRLYWMDLFTKAKRNRRGIKHPKGFIELIY